MALLADKEEEMAEHWDRPTLLVATDGSDASLHAGERATIMAGLFGTKLFVLYVVDPDEAFHAGIHYGEAVRESEEIGKEATAKIAALAQKGGVEHEELVIEGRPADTILQATDEVGAHYVFMGAEGMSRLGRAIVSSVSQEVLKRAERPVVLLVGGGRPPDDPLFLGFER